MPLRNRFQGRETQFHIELVYGGLFIAGFGYLAFRVDPRVAAFEGGLVVGYLLRVWEKMSIYERIIEESLSREVETEVEEQVEDEIRKVETEVEDEIQSEVEEQMDERVEQEVEERVESEVEERVDRRLGEEDR